MKRNTIKEGDLVKATLWDATGCKVVKSIEDSCFSSIQQCCSWFKYEADRYYFRYRSALEVHIYNKDREWSGIYNLKGVKIC